MSKRSELWGNPHRFLPMRQCAWCGERFSASITKAIRQRPYCPPCWRDAKERHKQALPPPDADGVIRLPPGPVPSNTFIDNGLTADEPAGHDASGHKLPASSGSKRNR